MMGLYISVHAFNYLLYLIFVLAVGTISVFYRLAYDAWYPNLIPNGMEQKGLCSQQYDLSACHHCNVPGGNLFV